MSFGVDDGMFGRPVWGRVGALLGRGVARGRVVAEGRVNFDVVLS